jgi:hypothetical protein
MTGPAGRSSLRRGEERVKEGAWAAPLTSVSLLLLSSFIQKGWSLALHSPSIFGDLFLILSFLVYPIHSLIKNLRLNTAHSTKDRNRVPFIQIHGGNTITRAIRS